MPQRPDPQLLKLRNDFRVFYNEHLKEDYAQLERIRKKYLFCCYGLFLLFLILPIGAMHHFGLTWVIPTNSDEWQNVVIYFCLMFSVCDIPNFIYKKRTKNLVMNKMISFFGDIKYNTSRLPRWKDMITQTPSPELPITDEIILASNLTAGFNETAIDDTFQGSYHQNKIAIAEEQLISVTKSGRHKNHNVVFTGVFIKLELTHPVTAQTIVTEKRNIFSALSYFLLCGRRSSVGKAVNLEDIVFSKQWDVTSENQIEARVLLTPVFMEKMLEVKRLFRGNKIDFSFWDNTLLIAVHSHKDMFETSSVFTPALAYHKVQEVITQFYSIFTLTDILDMQRDAQHTGNFK
jgi:hypothetical protein